MADQLQDYHFDLPEDLIAQRPSPHRDGCRLLAVGPSQNQHLLFHELPELLQAGSLLILNDTRVVPARVPVIRSSGGKGEMLIQFAIDDKMCRAMGRPSKRLKEGEVLSCQHDPQQKVVCEHYLGEGMWDISFLPDNPWPDRMGTIGEIPLPPYIQRKETGPDQKDLEDYQTVFGTEEGSAAAPTASLHFTEALLEKIQKRGVEIHHLTLHVGTGTFLPVRQDDIDQHEMHAESFSIPQATADAIARAKAQHRPVVAVGTTVVRALESAAQEILQGKGTSGVTKIFIRPPFDFRIVDRLITNFHLPESTLLMLVSALTGRERILGAYNEAVREGYRFFSYGDAMLLERQVQSS